ncbi:MAG: von Willebrand factor type A domain-containing protein [Planctomycetaceae bacterium]|jgi:hypothetical protein|nr:von Willebrand factor type A domain-containing protein [Planctomycetaceae bacterium]
MIDKNDPKLTAFALDELTDDEFLEIESEVNSNAELKAEVEAIRKIAKDVCEILSIEQDDDIIADTPREIDSPTQSKLALSSTLASMSTKRIGGRRYRIIGILSALVVVCIIIVTIINQGNGINKIAQNQNKETIAPPQFDDSISAPAFDKLNNSNEEILEKIPSLNENLELHQNKKIEFDSSKDKDFSIDNKYNKSILLDEEKKTKRSVLNTPNFADTLNRTRNYYNDQNPHSNATPILIKPDQYNNPKNSLENLDQNNKYISQNPVSLPMESNSAKIQSSSQDRPSNNLSSPLPRNDFAVTAKNLNRTLSSYDIMRQSINDGKLPPANEIKIDDYVNNFRYNYSDAEQDRQFAVQTDIIQCPWNKKNLLARVGIKKLTNKTTNNEIVKNNVSDKSDSSLYDASGEINDKIKIAIKFDKNKIRDYSPINDLSTKPDIDKENENNSGRRQIEIRNLEKTINVKDEITLLYEITPADQIDSKLGETMRADSTLRSAEIKSNLDVNNSMEMKKEATKEKSQQNRFNADDYFSIEIQDKEKSLSGSESKIIVRYSGYKQKKFSKLIDETITGETEFAAAVVLYGLLLQKNKKVENCDWNTVKTLATPNIKNDEQRKEFLKLIEKASSFNK